MKRNFTYLLGLSLMIGLSAKSQTFSVDGNFSEWESIPYAHTNTVDNNTAGNLTACKTYGDATNLYFYFEGTTALTLPKFDLYFNTDNNAQTGWKSGNFPDGTTGADLYFEGNTMGGGAVLRHSGLNQGWDFSGGVVGYFSECLQMSNVISLTGKKAFEFSIEKSFLGATSNTVSFQFIIPGDGTPNGSSMPEYWNPAAKYVQVQLTGATLPVELIWFKASEAGQTVKLDWVTASEQNNSHFDIYRSVEGSAFTKVATITGSLNSNAPKSYKWTDRNPLAGISYYKLVQVDLDGTSEEVGLESVNIKLKNTDFSVYAVQGNAIELYVYSERNTTSQFVLTDISGRILINSPLNLVSGQQIIRFPLTVNTGVNVATITTPVARISRKVLIH
ncbi:hypothetical protein [Desertivirga xinjiangensis]|uniref:hypothetical protein n=1 Tax=Desertivirga xinjiangensis TaxID=539206 RepID=UPI00210DD86F|nr:hypothetical protein [Pedobacter xinjiangensis]